MKRSSILLLLVCVFVAGVFVGIWLDWRVMKEKYGHQNLTYQVQNYPRANLAVYPGDKITLVPPTGGSATDLHINFVGYTPCTTPNGSNPCEIKTTAGTGPFFFTCSGDGYTCPDPGIQQSPTIPFQFGILKTDVIDVESLFGVPVAPPAPPALPPVGGHTPATGTAATAYVSCDTYGNTALSDLNGSPLNPIPALKGQTVFWISSQPFTLSGTPGGLCSNSDFPPSGSTQETQCDVALGTTTTVTYTVQAQSCNALPTAQLKLN